MISSFSCDKLALVIKNQHTSIDLDYLDVSDKYGHFEIKGLLDNNLMTYAHEAYDLVIRNNSPINLLSFFTYSDKLEINLFQANICIKESYEKYALKSYDTIIIRDVIEHIEDKELALTNIFNLLIP